MISKGSITDQVQMTRAVSKPPAGLNVEESMSYRKSDHKENLDRVTAVFQTNLGDFEAELYAKECPETV